jgi:hypothetical protein
MKLLFFIALSFFSCAEPVMQKTITLHAQMLILTRPGAGGVDTSNPVTTILSTDPNPVYGSATITVQINFSKPVTGFVVGDITGTNRTLSSFTALSQSNYTVVADPTTVGDFTIDVAAGVCTDLRGVINNAATTLTYTLAGNSGDLENASNISLLQHYRGQVASFTHCNDLLSSTSVSGMELIHCKYNFGATMFANGNNAFNQAIYNFGRFDFGNITFSSADYATVDPLITAIRNGNSSFVGSYKNGDDSYKSSMLSRTGYQRNSNFETHSQALPTAYTGWTDVTLSSLGVTYRDDYFAKTTQTDYYQGSQSTGDSRLAGYVSTVIGANGWYSDFVHEHWQLSNYPEHYFDQLIANIGSNDVYRGTVNKVLEYYYAKESVTNVTGLGATITVNHTKDWSGSPYDKIHTPVYIKLDATGTIFAGMDLTASNGFKIRKISTNVFYIPVLLNFAGSSSTVDLATTSTPNYINLTAPIVGRTGNAVTVDQPCKLSIFRVHKPTNITSSSTSFAIPTADNVTVNLTVATGLTLPADMTLRITNDASHYFYATVTSYTSGTGALVISSSSSANVGTGTFSSWTIDRFYHLVTADIVERNYNYVTSYTIGATLDNTNYTYYVAAINSDEISAVNP